MKLEKKKSTKKRKKKLKLTHQTCEPDHEIEIRNLNIK
jgi:hypothetical protein